MRSLFVAEKGQQNDKSIVFLHASGSSSQMWAHHIAELKNDFHCIAVDLPGHGFSRDIGWTNFNDVTEMIVDIIKNGVHGKPHLVGLSLGGGLVLKLLEKHADLFDRAIVDVASHEPINGHGKVIAVVYIMSLFKNTKLIGQLYDKNNAG